MEFIDSDDSYYMSSDSYSSDSDFDSDNSDSDLETGNDILFLASAAQSIAFPLFLFHSFLETSIFNDFFYSDDEAEEFESEGDKKRLSFERNYEVDPRTSKVREEMLKPLKGGFLFQLNYSPLIGKYLVHGEAEEGNFHYKSTNMRRYVDPPHAYLSRSIAMTSYSPCVIEWNFDFVQVKKIIVGSKIIISSFQCTEDIDIVWSILVGSQLKWKILKHPGVISEPFFHLPIDISPFILNHQKFKLKVELKGKKSAGWKTFQLFREEENSEIVGKFFEIKVWTVDETQSKGLDDTQDLSYLLDNQKDSNLLIKIGDKTIYCHREILAKRCNYFEALFSSGMSESQNNEISFTEVNYRVFLKFLKYIYSGGNIEDRQLFNFHQEKKAKHSPKLDVTDLLLVASRFNLIPLIQRCERKLISFVNFQNVQDLLDLSSDAGASQLNAYCEMFLEANKEELEKAKEGKKEKEEMKGDEKDEEIKETQETLTPLVILSENCDDENENQSIDEVGSSSKPKEEKGKKLKQTKMIDASKEKIKKARTERIERREKRKESFDPNSNKKGKGKEKVIEPEKERKRKRVKVSDENTTTTTTTNEEDIVISNDTVPNC